MNLYLIGHDYKYAAEQMLLTLYPTERPVYPKDDRAPGDRVEITFRAPDQMICRLTLGENTWIAAADVTPGGDTLERDRNAQRAVKLCFYRAAVAAGREKPAWGSITGVKPGKLMARYLREGKTAEDFAADFQVDERRAALCETATRAAMAAQESLGSGDIGLYVGIPFCPTRCAYCSFISAQEGGNDAIIGAYLEALGHEIHRKGRETTTAGQRPVALYIGGGTPTTLTAAQLDWLLGTISQSFSLSSLREYTVEAGRPETITADRLAVLQSYGVTRVCVNPQSMSDKVLRAIGRHHTAENVTEAMDLVRRIGNFQVNMDIIAGLPQDTEEGFCSTLRQVMDMAPENITVHTLAIKKGAALAARPQELPSGDEVGRMLDFAAERLSAAEYAPYYLYRQKYMSGGYENVGWTRPDQENLYNMIMMEDLAPVIALGAGGSTKIPEPGGAVSRNVNPKFPREYIVRMQRGRE